MPIAARQTSIVQRHLPILGWLPAYRRDWLLPDVLASVPSDNYIRMYF
jgi:hypothetical protein